MLNQLNRKPKKGKKCLPSDRRRDSFRSEMQRQARVESEIGDGQQQWRQQIGEIGSLACCNAAWDRQIGSLAPSNKRRHSLRSLVFVCVQSIVNWKFQTEKNEWDRTWRLSGSSEIGEKCVRKTKGKKKKTKALQQDQPKKNGLRLRLIHAA